MMLKRLSVSLREDGWRWTCWKVWHWLQRPSNVGDDYGWVPFEDVSDRPAPPPFRPRRDLIGHIEGGQTPVRIPKIDFDTPTRDEMAVARKGFGGLTVGAVSDRERLMRHTGQPECPIPEHADALRQLGRVVQERDLAKAEIERLHRQVEYLECRLHHPAQGDRAA